MRILKDVEYSPIQSVTQNGQLTINILHVK